jgi:hypothetical protein
VFFTGVVGVITALLASSARKEASEANNAVNNVKQKRSPDRDPADRTLYDLTWENHQKVDALTESVQRVDKKSQKRHEVAMAQVDEVNGKSQKRHDVAMAALDELKTWREAHLAHCKEQCELTRGGIRRLSEQLVRLDTTCPNRQKSGDKTCDDGLQCVATEDTERTPSPATSPSDSDSDTLSPPVKRQ